MRITPVARTSSWEDLVEAMTVIESGTAVNVKYHRGRRPRRPRSTRPATRPRRTSTAPRSSRAASRSACAAGSCGHHQTFEKEERFGKFQSMVFGDLIHGRRRDGRRDRVLRRELERRRRRPRLGERPSGRHGRLLRHVAAPARPEGQDVRRRDRGADARARHQHGSRISAPAAAVRRVDPRSAEARSTPRSSSGRRSSWPTT